MTALTDTAPDANGWMPIETAPKDGISVLITWHDCNDRAHVDTAWNSGSGWYPYDRPATHWQPLPKPPVQP